MKETFYRKNNLGVDIEYSIVGYYKEDGKDYLIYTDYTNDENDNVGIRLLVDLVNDSNNIEVTLEERNNIIEKFNNSINRIVK